MSNADPLHHAQIEWREDQPESTQFEDIYFSKEDGIAETEYVFLAANQLAERWQQLQSRQFHTIIETGFGTGLNFLCARRLWLKLAPEHAQLHYISCEKYPLSLDDLKRALSAFQSESEFTEGIKQLTGCWPAVISGFHRISFDGGRIQLTLLFGDAAGQLSQLNAKADTWFLDGFAPAKNPEMWSDQLFTQIKRLSGKGTQAATFTSAGIVKRGLQSAGFEISKIKGYGRKREMIVATKFEDESPAYQAPWLKRSPQSRTPEKVAIIGAGVAGASTAYALASRGLAVDIYEHEPEIASQGSGNPQGALYIKLPAKPTPESELHLRGIQYTQRMIEQLSLNDGYTAKLTGLLQVAQDEKDQIRLAQLGDSPRYPDNFLKSVSAGEASELAGTQLDRPGIFFPNAGWVAPRRFAKKLIRLSGATLRTNTRALSLEQTDDGWRINGQENYTQVVLCTAWNTELLQGEVEFGLKPIRGQTTWISSANQIQLNRVICSEGYISPPLEGRYCFGSSFVPGDISTEIREQDHLHNLDLIQRMLPEFNPELSLSDLNGKAAARAGSRDYLPLIGPVCSAPLMRERFSGLSTNAKARFKQEAPWFPGLYVNLGHGSKGLITCPLSAEIIAAQICNEPLPIEQDLVDILSPQRFTIRALKRSG